MEKKLPISAIVVGLNDAHWIKDFLETISFCDEILFFDIGSSDNTFDIANSIEGVTAQKHERVPIVEIIINEYHKQAKHDWILILDPDERVTPQLRANLFDFFSKEIPEHIAGMYAPWLFYFKKHQLKGTRWGGLNRKKILFNRNKQYISADVHKVCRVMPQYEDYLLPFEGENYIKHYWMSSYKQLIEKHRRYLKKESESRYNSNIRTGKKGILLAPLRSFHHCYIKFKGYKDGFYGLFLSCFWAWYETSALLGLYRYQQKNEIA